MFLQKSMNEVHRARLNQALEFDSVLYFPNRLTGTVHEKRGQMLEHLRAVHSATHDGEPHIVRIMAAVGAVPGDGATSRFFLFYEDGGSLCTWIGEDYGHAEIEIGLRGVRDAVGEAVRARFGQ